MTPAATSAESKPWKSALICGALLGGLLGVLFVRSLNPDEVVFSNDGPYGAMVAQQNRMPEIMTGLWQDLNWIGDQVPSPSPDVSAGLRLITSPLVYSKIFCPAALFILGICAWFCFRQWKLSPLACILGALATTFSSHFFSTACWGVAAQVIAVGLCFVAIGLAGDRSSWKFWVRLVLAGLAVGINIMEAYDIGAIFSLFVAAFILYESLLSESRLGVGFVKGAIRVAVVAGFAAFSAAYALTTLIGTQVKGVTDEKTNMTPEQRWDWATQWSMPPSELPRIFISGLYGYRMDTPKDMAAFPSWFEGGAYWGQVGQAPILDKYIEDHHAKGGKGMPPGIPDGAWRFNGGGEYAGVLVVVVALWTIAQSFRKKDSAFTDIERKLIWFWAVAAFICLLLATGRYGPFYRLFYMLPHAGNIRNASKFMHPFHWSLVILFAYGIHGLWKRYLAQPAQNSVPSTGRKVPAPQKGGWATLSLFDKRWTMFSLVAIGLSLLCFLVYALNHDDLKRHLMEVGFSNPSLASQMATFSIVEFGLFIVFLVLTVGLLTAIFMGRFAGNARWGAILLGGLLIIDLVRSDLPWIIYQNYVQKYASNTVIDFLRDKPYEHRVAIFPVDRFMDLQHLPPEAQSIGQLYGQLAGLYRIEWAQHHFLYNNIQALEDVQRPREAADFKAYERGPLAHVPFRHWELTDTKYFLSPAALGPSLVQQGFRPVLPFDIRTRPGVTNPNSYEQFTAVPPAGEPGYAIFEFTNALPRAQIYSNWQVNTNDEAVLEMLVSTNFNPHQTVLLSTPISLTPSSSTNQNPGSVEIANYAPKKVALHAKATAPSVLLLNDKYDPAWSVTVDGKPETVLRLNFIMRGVALQPGDHEVVFQFAPPTGSLYVSIAAIVLGLVLVGVLIVVRNDDPPNSLKRAAPLKKEK